MANKVTANILCLCPDNLKIKIDQETEYKWMISLKLTALQYLSKMSNP